MKKRKTVYGPFREYLVNGMRKKGHSGRAVRAAVDHWNDGSQPNGVFERAIFQAIQDIYVDMDKIEGGN